MMKIVMTACKPTIMIRRRKMHPSVSSTFGKLLLDGMRFPEVAMARYIIKGWTVDAGIG